MAIRSMRARSYHRTAQRRGAAYSLVTRSRRLCGGEKHFVYHFCLMELRSILPVHIATLGWPTPRELRAALHSSMVSAGMSRGLRDHVRAARGRQVATRTERQCSARVSAQRGRTRGCGNRVPPLGAASRAISGVSGVGPISADRTSSLRATAVTLDGSLPPTTRPLWYFPCKNDFSV